MQQQSETSTSAMIVVKLEEQDSVKSFDCGDDDLNDFILHESPLYRKEKLAVTYVLKDRISISDFDSKTKYNRFSRRFNSHKRLKSYPAAKIGRLAVHASAKVPSQS